MSAGYELNKSESQSLSGQFIAYYRVTRHLSSGGIGEVFLAEDTKLDGAAEPIWIGLAPGNPD